MRDRLSELGLVSFCRTTGGKGLHVVTPLARPKKGQKLNWAEAKQFARDVCSQIAAESPDRYLINMSKAKRSGKIFLDYLRSDQFSTAVAPLLPRARPNAPVHARDVGASKARSGSRAIYDPHRASAAEEVEGLGRLLRGRTVSA